MPPPCRHCGARLGTLLGLKYHERQGVCLRKAARDAAAAAGAGGEAAAAAAAADGGGGGGGAAAVAGGGRKVATTAASTAPPVFQPKPCPDCGRVFISGPGLAYHIRERVCRKHVDPLPPPPPPPAQQQQQQQQQRPPHVPLPPRRSTAASAAAAATSTGPAVSASSSAPLPGGGALERGAEGAAEGVVGAAALAAVVCSQADISAPPPAASYALAPLLCAVDAPPGAGGGRAGGGGALLTCRAALGAPVWTLDVRPHSWVGDAGHAWEATIAVATKAGERALLVRGVPRAPHVIHILTTRCALGDSDVGALPASSGGGDGGASDAAAGAAPPRGPSRAPVVQRAFAIAHDTGAVVALRWSPFSSGANPFEAGGATGDGGDAGGGGGVARAGGGGGGGRRRDGGEALARAAATAAAAGASDGVTAAAAATATAAAVPMLGVLGAVMGDGSLCVFAVPTRAAALERTAAKGGAAAGGGGGGGGCEVIALAPWAVAGSRAWLHSCVAWSKVDASALAAGTAQGTRRGVVGVRGGCNACVCGVAVNFFGQVLLLVLRLVAPPADAL